MKKHAVAGTCLVLAGIVFVGLQVHWQLLAKVSEDKRGSPIEEIRRGKVALSPSRNLKFGGALWPNIAQLHKNTREIIANKFRAMAEHPLSVINQSPMRPPLPPRPGQVLPVAEEMEVMPPAPPLPLMPQAADESMMTQQNDLAEQFEPETVGTIPLAPPLPPRPSPVAEEMGVIPPAPPLPLMPQAADEGMMTQQNDLLEQIRQGVPLKPVEKEERQPTLQDEIREGIQLRPVSDRELPEREKEVTLQDEVKQGVALKPASERVLAERPAKPLTVLDEIRQFDKSELKPLSEQAEKFEPEAASTIPLAPLAPPLPPRPSAVEPSPNLLEQIREGHPLRPIEERETRPAPAGSSEQDAIKQALREKFSGSEDEEEEEGMTPEEMGLIPPAPSMDGMIQPERRPESNQGLLEQIRAGKQLKPVSPSSRPAPEEQESAQKSLEKKILQYQQTVPETDESEYTESDWD